MSRFNSSVADNIADLMDLVSEKHAAENDPGSVGGATTHPSKSVDDGADDSQEGGHGSELTSKNKEEQGSPAVANLSEREAGNQESTAIEIGMKPATTGKDPSSETSRSDHGMSDPGSVGGATSHPAKLTPEESFKMGSYANDLDAFRGYSDSFRKQAADLLGDLTTAPKTEGAEKTASADSGANPDEAAQAGAALADMFDDEQVKAGADNFVVSLVEQAGLEGYKAAQLVADRLDAAKKAAEEEGGEDESSKKSKPDSDEGSSESGESSGGESSGGGSESKPSGGEDGGMSAEAPAGLDGAAAPAPTAPPAGPPMESGGGEMMMDEGGEGPSEEELMQLLAAGPEMGAEEAVGAMGAPAPPEDPMAGGMGGDPMAGGMGGDPMAGGGMGEVSPEMIMALLEELGGTPNQVMAAMKNPEIEKAARVKAASAIYTPKTELERRKQAYHRRYLQELLARSGARS